MVLSMHCFVLTGLVSGLSNFHLKVNLNLVKLDDKFSETAASFFLKTDVGPSFQVHTQMEGDKNKLVVACLVENSGFVFADCFDVLTLYEITEGKYFDAVTP